MLVARTGTSHCIPGSMVERTNAEQSESEIIDPLKSLKNARRFQEQLSMARKSGLVQREKLCANTVKDQGKRQEIEPTDAKFMDGLRVQS